LPVRIRKGYTQKIRSDFHKARTQEEENRGDGSHKSKNRGDTDKIELARKIF
jgi:hypothetical protein